MRRSTWLLSSMVADSLMAQPCYEPRKVYMSSDAPSAEERTTQHRPCATTMSASAIIKAMQKLVSLSTSLHVSS